MNDFTKLVSNQNFWSFWAAFYEISGVYLMSNAAVRWPLWQVPIKLIESLYFSGIAEEAANGFQKYILQNQIDVVRGVGWVFIGFLIQMFAILGGIFGLLH